MHNIFMVIEYTMSHWVSPVWLVCVLLFTVMKQLHNCFFFSFPITELTISHVNTERFLFVSVCGGQVLAGWSCVTVKNRCGHACCFRISARSLSTYCISFQFQPISAVAGLLRRSSPSIFRVLWLFVAGTSRRGFVKAVVEIRL